MSWVLTIDLGSTASAAVIVTDGGAPAMVDFDGTAVLPSSVMVADSGELLVGLEAERQVPAAPERYERSPKRRLGERVMLLGGRAVEPVDAVAAVLGHIADVAARQQGSPPDALRLTRPARWGRARLDALEEAARRAGLPDPVFIAEPVAAALFAADPNLEVGELVAVYDLGGGTLDTAVVRRSEHGFEVVGAPGGNEHLGGEQFDDLLHDHLGSRVAARLPEAWEQLRTSDERPWRRLAHDLRVEVRRAKEALSSATDYAMYLGAPLDMEVRISREELEAVIRPAVRSSVDELIATVRRTGAEPADVSKVYVVGGASRTPLVIRTIAEALGMMPVTWGDPKAAVVLGAASPAALATIETGGPRPEPTGSPLATIETGGPRPEPTGSSPLAPARDTVPEEPRPIPEPEPVPDPEPMPTPEPIPAPEPVPIPEPEPVPIPEPEPIPEPGPTLDADPASTDELTPSGSEPSPGGRVPTIIAPRDDAEAPERSPVNQVALTITLVCVVVAMVLVVILLTGLVGS